MLPLRSSRCGTESRIRSKVASTFNANIRCQPSRLVFSMVPKAITPAEFTRWSSPPKRSTVSSTTRDRKS